MAELPGLRAALQEHEARMSRLLAAQQEKLLLATLERFFGRPPTFGATGWDPTAESLDQGLAVCLTPREWLDQDLATERGPGSAGRGPSRGCSSRLLVAQQEKLILPPPDREGGVHELLPAVREAREVPRAGVPPLNLGALRKQVAIDDGALRKQAGLREVIEQQGVALKNISGAVARIEAILQPAARDADVLEAGALQSGAPPPRPSGIVAGDGDDCAGTAASSRRAPSGTASYALGPRQGTGGPGTRIEQAQRYCKEISHSRRFTLFTASMIIANSILLGVETNEAMTNPDIDVSDGLGYRMASAYFALVFLVELAVRWFSDGATFLSFRNPDFQWNVFDTLLIAITTAEEVLLLLNVNMDIIPLGFLRLSRLLKLTRMMRAFKLARSLKELRIMATGLVHCARPLFWAMVMIACLTYMTAVVISMSLTEYLQQHTGPDNEAIEFIDGHFSNLPECMYTLFEALAGGRDWGEIADTFRDISPILMFSLVLYILIGVFCLLNLLTAVFLEAAQRQDDVQDHVYAKRDWTMGVERFFLEAVQNMTEWNADPTATRITRARFIELMRSRTNVKFLEDNGVDLYFAGASRLGELFDIMDEDGNGDLDMNEFVQSLYNLKGPARALDLKLEHQKTMTMITSLQESLESLENSTLSRRVSLAHLRQASKGSR